MVDGETRKPRSGARPLGIGYKDFGGGGGDVCVIRQRDVIYCFWRGAGGREALWYQSRCKLIQLANNEPASTIYPLVQFEYPYPSGASYRLNLPINDLGPSRSLCFP